MPGPTMCTSRMMYPQLYDIIWNSRNSGEYENSTGKKKKGQPSLSKKYKVHEVTLHSILYVLNLVRTGCTFRSSGELTGMVTGPSFP